MLYFLGVLLLLAVVGGLVRLLRSKAANWESLDVKLGTRWYGTQSFIVANRSASPVTLLSVTLNDSPSDDCTFFWTSASDVPVLRSALDRSHSTADGFVLKPGERTRELMGYACGTEVVSVRLNTDRFSHIYTY
jgi:hypothetical protein